MTVQILIAPIVIVLLGFVIEKKRLLDDVFFDAAIEVIYRAGIPVIVLWGVQDNEKSLLS